MIEVDTREVLNLFSRLSEKKQRKAYRETLRNGSKILQKQTRQNLTDLGYKINKKKKWKNGETKLSNVWFSISKDCLRSTVHINYKRGKGDPRLRWLEIGTKERRTKKGYRRGKISKKLYFFKNAQNQTERQIFSSMERNLMDSIKKVSGK